MNAFYSFSGFTGGCISNLSFDSSPLNVSGLSSSTYLASLKRGVGGRTGALAVNLPKSSFSLLLIDLSRSSLDLSTSFDMSLLSSSVYS